jgi:hypothetical protein
MPGRPHRPGQHSIRIRIIYKVFFSRVPPQFPAEPNRDTAYMTNRGGTMTRFDVGGRLCPQPNTIKKILMVVFAVIKMNLIRACFRLNK